MNGKVFIFDGVELELKTRVFFKWKREGNCYLRILKFYKFSLNWTLAWLSGYGAFPAVSTRSRSFTPWMGREERFLALLQFPLRNSSTWDSFFFLYLVLYTSLTLLYINSIFYILIIAMCGTVVQDKLPSGTLKFILIHWIYGIVLMHCSQGQISGWSWMCTGPPC